MKKLLSLLVTLSLMPTVHTFAEDTTKMQNILASVKQRITDTEEFDKFNSNYSESDGEMSYYFSWYSEGENYKSLDVNVCDDGVITNYNYYDSKYNRRNDKPVLDELTSSEALEKTKKLVKVLNPDIYENIVFGENQASLFDNTYSFPIKLYYNSIPVNNANGNVTVDHKAEKILNFDINYISGLSYESAEGVIDTYGAWKAFSDNAGVELLYELDYSKEDSKVVLVYRPEIEYNSYIDAKSGEIKKISYDIYSFNTKQSAMEEATMDMARSMGASFTEQELAEFEEIEGLITQKEVEEIIRGYSCLDIDADAEISSIRLNSYDESKTYSVYFSKENKNCAYASINAKTGELMSWRSYSDYDYEKETDTKTAQKALEMLLPKYYHEYKLSENEKTEFNYIRYVNDVKFPHDYVNISVNSDNGKVSAFSYTYTDKEFPSPENVISAYQIIKILSANAELELRYIPLMNENRKRTVALGYINDGLPSYRIDAIEGVLKNEVNQNDEELIYSDISEHYAKTAIETLAHYGIGFEGGKFKPDEIITQEDYVSLLMATFISRSPVIIREDNEISYLYKMAQSEDIIRKDEENPKDALKREMAAVYMIRILGIEEYAQLEGIYNCMFEDVHKNIGAITILGAMKVFNGDGNGCFNPENNITRAEAAVMIYNYLINN
ncbi:MAG: S-layer homology domain-containing protein [Clostridia bacterium]|nr:S-layer homology domain-containing protein [Clostridia bacterium]